MKESNSLRLFFLFLSQISQTPKSRKRSRRGSNRNPQPILSTDYILRCNRELNAVILEKKE